MTEGPLLVETDLEEFQAGDVDLNLAAAVAAVRGYCRWHIAPERTEEMTLRAVGGRVILPTLRATAVTIEDADGAAVSVDDYELEAGFLRITCSAPGPLTVTLTHGYSELPADVKRVALSMANSGATTVGGRLKSAGPFTYEFPEGSEDAAVLDRYRLAPRP